MRQPWPTFPMLYKVTSAHEEGGERVYAVSTTHFEGDAGRQRPVAAHERGRVHRRQAHPEAGHRAQDPGPVGHLAMGFTGTDRENGLVDQFGLELDERGNIARTPTSRPTCRVCSSPVTPAAASRSSSGAIAEGRSAARGADSFLTGASELPASIRPRPTAPSRSDGRNNRRTSCTKACGTLMAPAPSPTGQRAGAVACAPTAVATEAGTCPCTSPTPAACPASCPRPPGSGAAPCPRGRCRCPDAFARMASPADVQEGLQVGLRRRPAPASSPCAWLAHAARRSPRRPCRGRGRPSRRSRRTAPACRDRPAWPGGPPVRSRRGRAPPPGPHGTLGAPPPARQAAVKPGSRPSWSRCRRPRAGRAGTPPGRCPGGTSCSARPAWEQVVWLVQKPMMPAV